MQLETLVKPLAENVVAKASFELVGAWSIAFRFGVANRDPRRFTPVLGMQPVYFVCLPVNVCRETCGSVNRALFFVASVLFCMCLCVCCILRLHVACVCMLFVCMRPYVVCMHASSHCSISLMRIRRVAIGSSVRW